MTHVTCQRTWQVEAARDSRLTGSDLSNALRHRSECADCKQAARELDQLGLRLKALPQAAPDALTQRRTRQALLSAWNAQLLAEPQRRASIGGRWIAAVCAVSSAALALGILQTRSTKPPAAPHSTVLEFEPKRQVSSMPEPSSSIELPARASLPEAPPSAVAKIPVARVKPITVTDTAEDDAYLQIVTLLQNGHEREARTKAAQYLVRFPHGFRRVEVAKIAAH